MKRQQIVSRAKALEDAQRAEEELLARAEKAAYLTLEEIIAKEPKMIEVYVPALDCKIKIKPINVEDYLKSLKFRSQRDEEGTMNYFVHMLLSSWGKCDPTVTEEKLRKMNLATLVKITAAIPIPKIDITQNPLRLNQLKPPPEPRKAA